MDRRDAGGGNEGWRGGPHGIAPEHCRTPAGDLSWLPCPHGKPGEAVKRDRHALWERCRSTARAAVRESSIPRRDVVHPSSSPEPVVLWREAGGLLVRERQEDLPGLKKLRRRLGRIWSADMRPAVPTRTVFCPACDGTGVQVTERETRRSLRVTPGTSQAGVGVHPGGDGFGSGRRVNCTHGSDWDRRGLR